MKRILFVDDERNILEGLRNRLRHQHRNWNMEFVKSARDALEVFPATGLPDRVRQAVSETRSGGGPMCEVENRLLGVTHAEVGAYPLGLWQIPFSVVEAVANHRAPGRAGRQAGFDIVAGAHVAGALANERLQSAGRGANHPHAGIDATCLEKLGVSAKLAGWRETANELAQGRSDLTGAQ